MTIEKTETGLLLSQFDGDMWHRESFKTIDELLIWAHQNGIEIEGIA